MKILFSKYYLPFREYPMQGIYFIPKDFHWDIFLGRLDAHIQLYNQQPRLTLDPATGRRFLSDPNLNIPYRTTRDVDVDLLDDLYFQFGVKAAGRQLGYESSDFINKQAMSFLSRCR